MCYEAGMLDRALTETVPAAPVRGEIVALTSLRGLAALAVVMQHFSATAQEHAAVMIPSLVPHGYVAVDLFFVLSGFIMSYTYLASFQARGPGAFWPFFVKRVARIVPLNTAVLGLFVLAGVASGAVLGRNIFYQSDRLWFDLPANVLLLQGLGVGANLNGPSWSISVEFAAYLLFPALTLLVFGAGRWWVVGPLAGVLALVWLAAMQTRLGLGIDGMPLNLVRCVAEFAIGMGCYRVSRAVRWAVVFRRDGVAVAFAVAAAAFMAGRVDLFAVLMFPGVIVALAVNRGWVARVMGHGALHGLGEVSFSLYLIHQLFRPLDLVVLRAVHPAPLGMVGALGFALAGSLAVVPFAWVTYRVVERPGRRVFRRLAG